MIAYHGGHSRSADALSQEVKDNDYEALGSYGKGDIRLTVYRTLRKTGDGQKTGYVLAISAYGDTVTYCHNDFGSLVEQMAEYAAITMLTA